ncbi:MAG: hypothetical protein M3534_04550 [Actinomycetota bacterium]|nr:hypothetical protein [Actinomycetota bacterium]
MEPNVLLALLFLVGAAAAAVIFTLVFVRAADRRLADSEADDDKQRDEERESGDHAGEERS